MRRSLFTCFVLVLALLLLAALAAPAQAAPPTYNLSWAALDPGDDWSARVILSLFPVSPAPGGAGAIGAEATVIGTLVGTITGFVAAIAMAFVCYSTIMQIHRGAETARMLDRNMSAMFLVRMGVAAVLMYPLDSGFSAGQKLVVQSALWGAGMAKTVYAIAVQAIGPDSMVVAQPIIPGTKTIVANLIQDELCRALVNAATAQPNFVPVPTPQQVLDIQNSGYITWSYSLSAGNATAAPACGTVTVRSTKQGSTNIAGVSVDMTGMQRDVLTQVLTNDIRPTAEAVARQFWQTKKIDALRPLAGMLTTATTDYTNQLTQAATRKTNELRAALQDATQARNGSVGLVDNQVQLASLGWTAAGAYYLEFTRLNGQTMSLVSATPTVNTPSYEGLGRSLSRDLAPLETSSTAFMTKLMTYVRTTDGLDVPGGNGDLFQGATPGEDGASTIEQVFRGLRLNDRLLNLFVEGMSPTANTWTDPFSGLMQLGHKMAAIALTALGLAGLLNSAVGSAAATVWSLLSGNPVAAGAAMVGHFVVSFLAVPIFALCMAILVPALTIAFVLPMIPWLMFLAGVLGWLVLVCEAVIAFPFWMLAHMTFGGEGMHGRASEGYSLLFSIFLRPPLMVIGLFLGGFIFTAASWLIRQTFGIAAGFVLANGWLVTNVIGVAVLLTIFTLTHIVSALLSFRMISLIPHHVPRLAGFGSANRVDMDQFGRDAALVGAAGALRTLEGTIRPPRFGPGDGASQAGYGSQSRLPAPSSGGQAGTNAGGMDSTLRAATDVPPQPPPREEA